MFKKLMTWLAMLGLSFVVADVLHWCEQGKAFLYIYFGSIVIFTIISFIFMAIDTIATLGTTPGLAISWITALLTMLFLGGYSIIILLIAWGIAKVFSLDFYVIFEVLALVTELLNKNKVKVKIQVNNKRI